MFLCFLSSRRRHTRLQGDWSADVCSSDLDYVSSHSDLVARSREWANRIDAYNHLAELAVAVDAPGNDVFETHDVAAERARVAAALAQFRQEVAAQHLALDRSRASTVPALHALLDTIAAELDSVSALAQRTFTAF